MPRDDDDYYGKQDGTGHCPLLLYYCVISYRIIDEYHYSKGRTEK
jgi:hypothetical protein